MLLLLDWDETLTVKDTLSLIPSPHPEHGPGFDHYTDAYMADMEAHSKTHPLADPSKRADLASQLEFLASLEEVEVKSVTRVKRGNLFRGWRPQEAEKRAREVDIRNGVESRLSPFLAAHSNTVQAVIVSVSWSARFIAASLRSVQIHPYQIRANEIEIDPQTGLGTGKMTKSADNSPGDRASPAIRTALDKLSHMRALIEERDSSNPDLVIFAGDSNTDMPCLIAASVGLVVASEAEGSLESTLNRCGLSSRLAQSAGSFIENIRSSIWAPKLVAQTSADTSLSSEGVRKKASEDVCLVKVRDWVEGVEVLEELRRWQTSHATSAQTSMTSIAA